MITLSLIFGMTIAELITSLSVLLTFFTGILYMNIKLTRIETKVKDIEDRENKSDLLIIETAKILKETTLETSKILKEATVETARLLSITTEKSEKSIEKRITSLDEKVNTILNKLLDKHENI